MLLGRAEVQARWLLNTACAAWVDRHFGRPASAEALPADQAEERIASHDEAGVSCAVDIPGGHLLQSVVRLADGRIAGVASSLSAAEQFVELFSRHTCAHFCTSKHRKRKRWHVKELACICGGKPVWKVSGCTFDCSIQVR